MKKIFILIIPFLMAYTLFAGDESRKGTTAADQLLIPVGARGIATGGAFLANIKGLESIYYNPAGLDHTKKTEAMFNYMNYIADINISYFAVSTSLGEIGSIGLSFKSIDAGDIPVTTNDFPDGTGEKYSPSFLVVGLTYSKVLTDRVSVGTNLKLISESIENTSATGFALDVGVQYYFSEELALGASLKNIGPNLKYSGQDLRTQTGVPSSPIGSPNGTYEVVSEAAGIPSYFEISLAYGFLFDEKNNLDLAATYVANNSLEDQINLGIEYDFMNNFFLRAGYNLQVENASSNIFGITLGAGLNYEFGEDVGISFDYAFRDVKEFPTSNHIFTVKLAFQ